MTTKKGKQTKQSLTHSCRTKKTSSARSTRMIAFVKKLTKNTWRKKHRSMLLFSVWSQKIMKQVEWICRKRSKHKLTWSCRRTRSVPCSSVRKRWKNTRTRWCADTLSSNRQDRTRSERWRSRQKLLEIRSSRDSLQRRHNAEQLLNSKKISGMNSMCKKQKRLP